VALGEFQIIEKYFSSALAGREDVILGVGDDAALMRVPRGRELVVAVDTIVAGMHFPPESLPESVGYRALAVNLSDLAAMGATPAWFTLALTLPLSLAEESWLEGFSRGLLDLARQFDMALVGGDTTSGPLAVTVQVMGHVAKGAAVRRSGAGAGDAIFVSGTPGDAAAGLAILQGRLEPQSITARAHLLDRFLRPVPRVALGLALGGVASAAIDVSDGLLGDLEKLLVASGRGARVEIDKLPLSAELAQSVDVGSAIRSATAGGDDYELCFTVPPSRVAALSDIQQRERVALTRIGTVEATPGLRCFRDGRPLELRAAGFDHFTR
jgi:thiamine-monophosphate kinase